MASVWEKNTINFRPTIRIDIQGSDYDEFVSEQISIFKGVLIALKNTAWDMRSYTVTMKSFYGAKLAIS